MDESAAASPASSNLSAKMPMWTTGPAKKAKKAKTPRTVRGTNKIGQVGAEARQVGAEARQAYRQELPRTADDGAASSALDDMENTVRGDAYHYGLCTLHIKRLSQNLVTEAALWRTMTDRLDLCGKTGTVIQVTVRDKAEEMKNSIGSDGRVGTAAERLSWGLVTFSNVTSANRILSRNASHVDGVGLEMHTSACNPSFLAWNPVIVVHFGLNLALF